MTLYTAAPFTEDPQAWSQAKLGRSGGHLSSLFMTHLEQAEEETWPLQIPPPETLETLELAEPFSSRKSWSNRPETLLRYPKKCPGPSTFICPLNRCHEAWLLSGWHCWCPWDSPTNNIVLFGQYPPCQNLSILQETILEGMPRGSSDPPNCQSNVDILRELLEYSDGQSSFLDTTLRVQSFREQAIKQLKER